MLQTIFARATQAPRAKLETLETLAVFCPMTALTVTVRGVTVRSKTSERTVQARQKSVECTSLRTFAPRLDVAASTEYSAASDKRSILAVSSSRLQLAGNGRGAASMALPRWRSEVPIAGATRRCVALPRCRCCLDAGAASMAHRGAYSDGPRHARLASHASPSPSPQLAPAI